MPVDNDLSSARAAAYAIADPGGATVEIELSTYDQDGDLLHDGIRITLPRANSQRDTCMKTRPREARFSDRWN